MTRTIIRDTVRKKLGETTAVFWTDSILNQWIEDATLDIVWRAKCNKQRSTATSTASTLRYTLSDLVTDILRIFKVRVYNSATEKWIRIPQRTQEWLDTNYPHWESSDAGVPLCYIYDTEIDEFIIYPQCNSDHVGTDYIEFYNSAKPTAISADGGSPDIPAVLHPAVIDYVVATGLDSRGYTDIANNTRQLYFSKVKSYMIERDWEEDEEIIMHSER